MADVPDEEEEEEPPGPARREGVAASDEDAAVAPPLPSPCSAGTEVAVAAFDCLRWARICALAIAATVRASRRGRTEEEPGPPGPPTPLALPGVGRGAVVPPPAGSSVAAESENSLDAWRTRGVS